MYESKKYTDAKQYANVKKYENVKSYAKYTNVILIVYECILFFDSIWMPYIKALSQGVPP